MELISAIATPQGRGGIAVVRLSGEGALSLARNMFSRKGEFTPNMMYPGEIDCGTFTDYGLCVYFAAPKSFTGEDVVEFHCHGGTEIVRGLFKRTLELGARPAERGEFTRRAYLNGKLSLSAVEGMGEMISAQSQAQVRAGYSLYTEKLTEEGRRLQGLLTTCLASVDADVDYPEEDLTTDSRAEVGELLTLVCKDLQALLSRYGTGRKIKSGVNVVLCGRPNAGKSSLFNALLGYDRAIVSSTAGTTRDTVEGSIEIRGVLFHLTDTAGLREGESDIEEEGVRRAERAVRSADVVVWLKEEDAPPVGLPAGVPLITVGAKMDIIHREGCDVSLSAHTGEGLEELRDLLYLRGCGEGTEDVLLLTERHFYAVSQALEAAQRALSAVEGGLPAELYAQDIAECRICLGLLSGETATEAVINEIFSHFCVGK